MLPGQDRVDATILLLRNLKDRGEASILLEVWSFIVLMHLDSLRCVVFQFLQPFELTGVLRRCSWVVGKCAFARP